MILAIAREISDLTAWASDLEPDWDGEQGVTHARQLVEAAIELWRKYREIFSIVGILADKRYGEFAAVRVRQMRTLYKSQKPRSAKPTSGWPDPTPRSRRDWLGTNVSSIIFSAGPKV